MPQPAARQQRNRADQPNIVPIRPPRDNWEAAVGAFLEDCRVRNLSASTIENYHWYLTNSARTKTFLVDHGMTGPADMTPELMKKMTGELLKSGLSPRTVDTFQRILKTFIGFCIREGYGGEEKALKVAGVRLPKHEPETFTRAEDKIMLDALKDRPRDLMLFDFMLRTGLRLAEVCNVNLDDIVDSPTGSYVRVRQGKGRKDRIVPLDTTSDKLSDRLRRYIARVRPRDTAQTALFLANRRDGGDFVPLTPHGVQTLMKRLSRDTGVHINPHKFRHTFSTRALAAGVDVMALQRALGHTTLTMVSRYVHYQRDDLLDAWRQRRD